MAAKANLRPSQRDPAWVRWGLIALAVAFLGVLVVVPIVNVFRAGAGIGAGGILARPFRRRRHP